MAKSILSDDVCPVETVELKRVGVGVNNRRTVYIITTRWCVGVTGFLQQEIFSLSVFCFKIIRQQRSGVVFGDRKNTKTSE